MRRGEGQIAEPWLRGVGFLDETQRVVGEGVRRVEVRREFFDLLAVVHELGDGTLLLPGAETGELLASSADEREMTLKAALARPAGLVLTKMPFPNHESLIARLAQRLRQGHDALFLEAKISRRADAPPQLIRRALFVHVADAGLMRIQPAHERSTRGAALSAIVKPRQPHTTRRQRIKRRSAHLAAVATEVGVAHVVHHDEEDVRRHGGCRRDYEQEDEGDELAHHEGRRRAWFLTAIGTHCAVQPPSTVRVAPVT